jgi:NAD(P) transhydrogenase subunit alpha
MEAINPAVLIASLSVFVLAAFLGYQLISRVPPLLHTPLMSATNAISGISLIGSMVIAGMHKVDFHALMAGGAVAKPSIATLLGFVAVITAATNVVGGFGITDRMLKMFQQRKKGVKGESK